MNRLGCLAYAETNERDRVMAAMAGDRAAFDALAKRYRPISIALARRFLTPDAAEDAVQDAILTAMKAIPQLADPDRFAPWLAAIVRNRCRRIARQTPSMTSIDELRFAAPSAQWGSLYWTEPPILDRLDLERALRALPAGLRQLVGLYYRDGMTVAEISAFLSLPATTVKWQLHAARAALRRRLEPKENP